MALCLNGDRDMEAALEASGWRRGILCLVLTPRVFTLWGWVGATLGWVRSATHRKMGRFGEDKAPELGAGCPSHL